MKKRTSGLVEVCACQIRKNPAVGGFDAKTLFTYKLCVDCKAKAQPVFGDNIKQS